MSEIVFDKNIEDANRKEIEKYLKPYLWLIPIWVQEIKIQSYASDDAALIASTEIREQYRESTLTIYARWFVAPEKEKTDAIIHELCHFYSNPLYDFARNAIRKYAKDSDEELKTVIFDEMECYLERQTQDLTFAIINKFNESKADLQN